MTTTDERYRIARLKRRLEVLAARVVRERVAACDILRLEPAPSTFDVPTDDADWQPFAVGQTWGTKQAFTHFRGTVAAPAHWTGEEIELHLHHRAGYLERAADDTFPAGPEGFVFVDGRRVGAIDSQHARIRLALAAGETRDVRAVFFASRGRCRHELATFALEWVGAEARRLRHDLRTTVEVAELLDASSPARERLLRAVEASIRRVDFTDVAGEFGQIPSAGAGFHESIADARKAFDAAMGEIEPAGEVPEVLAVGHAHIDLAWLWPTLQSRHKCVRTFSTQVRLIDEFPDWSFLQAQAQAYRWIERDAPDLMTKIRERVAAGRWEVEGSLWAECDTNVTGGESLVRQLLYGKRYFRETFGVDSTVVWLPDVFGYSAAFPQLMKLAGVGGFVTSKISWNETDRFPHDTFRWRGIDGTEVPSHFITTPCRQWFYTYNATLTPAEVKATWEAYSEKQLGLEALMSFGFGDGGGGPTEEMLRTASSLRSMPAAAGMPRVKFGKVADLMARIAARADELPVWDGELYLEYHRGTYTSQGWLKRANRKNEIRLHNAEWAASLAAPFGYALERARMDALWEDLLLGQFHDVLPGTSVHEVYDEFREVHRRVAEGADAVLAEALDVLADEINTSGASRPVILYNTLSWDRRGPVQLPDGTWRNDVTVPANGWCVIDADAPAPPAGGLSVSDDGRRLSNAFWEIELDADGCITRLYDRKACREVLRRGDRGNIWQRYLDRPRGHDAWNIESDYEAYPLEAPTCESIAVAERGNARVAVDLCWTFATVGERPPSTIAQRIVLWAGHPRIDFETEVDWHEHHQLLKVAFPVDVRAREAACEIQFGHLMRPTHRNTSWDEARYEWCAQRFIDLGEHGYGVALMNDCKYGCDVRDHVMRLTCIKSPQSPDAQADQGGHAFTYSLLPHAGTFQDAGVIRSAAELNVPVIAADAKAREGTLPATYRFVTCSSDAVVIDTIKPAEDRDGIVLRLYESHGSHAGTTLTFARKVASVTRVDLLEDHLEDCPLDDGKQSAPLRLKPFEVLSLRVRWSE